MALLLASLRKSFFFPESTAVLFYFEVVDLVFSRDFVLPYVTSGVILGYGVDRSESWFLGFEITVGPLGDLAEDLGN